MVDNYEVKSELLYLKEYGFSEILLEEIYLKKFNPIDVIFKENFSFVYDIDYILSKEESILASDYEQYIKFKKIFYKENFSTYSNGLIKIHKVFFKYDCNNLNYYFKNDFQPLFMYASGKLDLLDINKKKIAIIGSRDPNDENLGIVRDCVKHFNKKDYMIVSGFAKGIDLESHIVALCNSYNTIAILPSSFKNIYPLAYSNIAYDISKKGLLLSSFGPNSKLRKENFLERNKYIASISDILVVIEVNLRSGTMNTIRTAVSLGKKVFCFKQKKLDVNNEIKKLGGILIESVDEIWYYS